jgi:hypothetical protein
MIFRNRALTTCLCACALAAPRQVLAGDRAAADVLFSAGQELTVQRRYVEACLKFEASYKLDRTLGTLLHMADCHERIGKIALAWSEWGEASELASRRGDSRAAYAGRRWRALEPRLPRLQVKVTEPRAGLAVLHDGALLEPGSYGVALPVDPGEHVVVVKRGDEVLKEERVQVAERATVAVALDLEAIEEKAPAPAAGTALPANRRKTLGLMVGGGGAALFAGAAVFEILALTGRPGPSECSEKFCTPDGLAVAHRARTRATVGQWMGLGGLVLVGAGTVLFLTAPSSAPPPITSARRSLEAPVSSPGGVWLSPWAGPGGGGIDLGGAL